LTQPLQAEVIALLSSPATHGGAPVDRIETHSAIVFLAGERAWKMKRAVRYEYLDFGDVDRRRELCEAEVRINRRTSAGLYHGVVAVTRESDGSLRLGGRGEPVEWVIEMSRFAQDDLFDRLAARGVLDLDLMRALAAAIAQFHRGAQRRTDHGGSAGMRWVVEGNARDLAAMGAGVLDPALCSALATESLETLERCASLLDDRRAAGYVRQCHGDLHLRNIVLWQGVPTPFDAVEFNDEIACVDVLYDLAFLLMDLSKRGLPRHANLVWNDYLAETLDLGGLALVPLFLSCRAAVRAKTSLVAAGLQSDEARRGELQVLAREYLRMALELLRPPPPCLIAIGGFSGTGKSSLAWALAPSVGGAPGALLLRSDAIRKRLCGVPELTHLGDAGYASDISRRVYETLAERATLALRAGRSVIADAVFARPADRSAIEAAAARARAPFAGCWLEAPEHVLLERVAGRERDASDADAGIVRRQLSEGVGPLSWDRVDASAGAGVVLERALSTLERRVGDHLSASASGASRP
jgi:aminoglycoside phosphotransferase family enzyme/predicted kinase